MSFVRLAAFGALGAVFGIGVLFVLLVIVTIPTPTGGLNWTHAQLTWISVGGIVLALIAVHLAYARILLAAGRGTR